MNLSEFEFGLNCNWFENALKWNQWEPEYSQFQTDDPDNTILWAKQNGMGVRGHCLFWAKNVSGHFPSWAYPLRGNDMKAAIDHRIESAVMYYDVRNPYNKQYMAGYLTEKI